MSRLLALFASLMLLTGCSEISNSSRSAQPLNTRLVAGIGDEVVRIDMRESLPNVFGKADLFGRTRPTGMVFVTYLGIEQGRAVFDRRAIHLHSDATTMNSTPIVIPQASTTTYSGSATFIGTTPGGPVMGNAMSSGLATTTAPPIILPPTGSHTQVIANDRIRVYLDLTKDRKLVVEGKEILIEEATPSAVTYRVRGVGTGAP